MSEQHDDGQPSTEPRSFYDAPKAGDEVYQGFDETRPVRYALSPSDDMPMQLIDDTSLKQAEVKPLEVDTLVCMADESEFVLRELSWGEVIARFEPHEVTRNTRGRWVVSTQLAVDRLPEQVRNGAALAALEGDEQEPSAIVAMALHGDNVVDPTGRRRRRRRLTVGHEPAPPHYDDTWTEVEPLRAPCKHYARQLIDHPGDLDRKKLVRLCTARRDEHGEFLSLSDDRMHACELRNPPHPASTQQLDDADRRLLAEGARSKTQSEEWDVDKALAEMEQDADYSVLGN